MDDNSNYVWIEDTDLVFYPGSFNINTFFIARITNRSDGKIIYQSHKSEQCEIASNSVKAVHPSCLSCSFYL